MAKIFLRLCASVFLLALYFIDACCGQLEFNILRYIRITKHILYHWKVSSNSFLRGRAYAFYLSMQ